MSHPYSLVFHLGFWLFGFCIAELLLILFCFCFPFGFARLGTNTGAGLGLGPSGQYFFLSRLIFKKKKKDLGPLQKAWAPSEIVTQLASPHVKKKINNNKKRF